MPTRKEVVKFAIGCSILLAVVSVLLLSIIPWKTNSVKHINGIKFHRRSVEDSVESVTLKIYITHKNYLIEWWKQDTVEGGLSTSDVENWRWNIEGDTFTKSEKLYGYKWVGVEHRIETENGSKNIDGRMLFNDNLSQFLIMTEDENIEEEYPDVRYDEIFYVFPAEDIDEAIDIANEWTFYRIEKK